MHCVIHSRPYWDATVVFEEPLMQELKFWFENIHAFAEFRLDQPSAQTQFCTQMQVILLTAATLQLWMGFHFPARFQCLIYTPISKN